MKNFIEKLKDFLYDGIDYMLIFVIVIAVAGIIGWRLDILFAVDMNKSTVEYIEDSNSDNVVLGNDTIESEDEVESPNDIVENDTIEDEAVEDDINEDSQSNNPAASEDNDIPSTDTVDIQQNEVIIVKIPQGSLAPTIADILINKGLITNKMDFLNKSQELELDTKLKSGEFEIETNSSLEDIIRIIAK